MNEPDRSSPFVRPYAVTRGRTRARYEFALEALVSTAVGARQQRLKLPPEQRAICDLCVEIKSVAEVSALLGMPLGVARILVADLSVKGLVSVEQPGNVEGRPDVSLLERVLVGLRSL
ncbi:DUF742 domain-containing protein [Streptomyces sp. HNM0575]|uniref:DUF742 domain-containing protein n=1 Tax=Streptomyces sp. HNM0575 TaxID=2716338 RepID=UPI0032176469